MAGKSLTVATKGDGELSSNLSCQTQGKVTDVQFVLFAARLVWSEAVWPVIPLFNTEV
jgi:hypothetical protein